MVVAGAPGLAALVGVGRHFSRGRPGRRGLPRSSPPGIVLRTASAHGRAELVQGVRAGADAIFLSPVFPTASHPGGAALGVVRWAAAARTVRAPVLALGGINAATARRLPRHCCMGAGLIGAAQA